MPNYDLGLAHGKIKITADTRGATETEAKLAAMSAKLADVSARLADAEAALGGYEEGTQSSAKSTRQLVSEMRQMAAIAATVKKAMNLAVPAFKNLRKETDGFTRNPGFLRGLSAITPKMLLFNAALGKAGRGFLNYNNAMRNASSNTQRFLGIIGKVTAATAGYAFLKRYGGLLTGFAGRFGAVQKAVGLAQRGLRELVGTAAGGQAPLARFARGILGVGLNIRDIGKEVDRTVPKIGKLFGSLGAITTGGLLVKQAGRDLKNTLGFLTKIPKKFIAIGAVVVTALRPLLEIGAKGLVGISNGIALIGNAGKTLAGGFLAVPGAIATAVTAVSTLKVLGKGLSRTFEEVFAAKTPEELTAALEGLDPALRGTGERLSEIKTLFEEVQDEMVLTFNKGLERDLINLGNVLGGVLANGMIDLSDTFADSRSKLVDFVTSADTVSEVSTLFSQTNVTVRNLTDALIPLLTGLRDIGSVGAGFIRDLSGGAQTLTERFANFAKVNRENGNLLRWMQDGRKGLVDLGKGVVDATKGVYELLTLFQTNTGENALERFAKSMKKFNDAVSGSKANGVLRNIADTVKTLGTEKLENFLTIFRRLGEFKGAGANIFQALEKSADAFVKTIITLLDVMSPLINAFASVLQFVSPVVGKMLAFAAAAKIATVALLPLRAVLAGIIGGAILTKGVAALGALALTVGKFGALGSKAATGLTAIGLSLAGMTGPLIAVSAAFLGLKLAIDEGFRQNDAAADALNQSIKNAKENADQLVDAFQADNGKAGKSVFTQVKSDLDELMADLDNQAKNAPGFLGNVVNQLGNISEKPSSANGKNKYDTEVRDEFGIVTTGPDESALTEEQQKLNDSAKAAEAAKGAFDRLGISNEQLARTVQGSKTAFDAQVAAIKASGNGGEEAAAALQGYRDTYTAIEGSFTAAGDGGQQLSAGIQAIADAGSDATSKLEGLKLALQGLGLLQTSALESAFAFEESVRTLGDKAVEAASGIQNFDDILTNTGGFNTASVGAQQLFNVLQPVADQFLRTAVESGNAQDALAKITPEVGKVASAFGKSEEQINGLLATLGVDANTVDILVRISGLEEADQKVAQTMLAIQNGAKDGLDLPVNVTMKNPEDAAARIRALLGEGAVTNETAGGFSIPAKFVADPNSLAILQGEAAKLGLPLQFPGGPPVPAENQPKIPAAPAPTLPGGKPDEKPGVAAPAATPAPTPEAPVVDTSQLDAAKGEVEALKAQIADLNANPPKVEVDPAQFEALKAGTAGAVAAFNEMKAGITAALGEAQNAVIAFGAGINAILSGIAAGAFANGAAIGSALAAGLQSQVSAVQGAADALAGAVAGATKPGSPTKRGPLSGQGWTGYSGAKLGKSFADSLASQRQAVESAADSLAGGVANNLNTTGRFGEDAEKAGSFLGQLSQMVSFAQNVVGAVDKISKALLGAVKFISDPEGKGTFFGKSAGGAFGFRRDPEVSDKELQDKRDEELQNKLQGGTKEKNLTPEEKDKEAQQKKDAETQAAITAEAIDRVIAGERVAPVSEEEKQALKDATKEGAKESKDTKDDKSLAEKAAKSQTDFANTARDQAASLSQFLDTLTPEELGKVQSGEVSVKTQDQMLEELKKQTPLLGEAIDVSKKDSPGEEESIKALTTIQSLMDQQGEAKTPAQKQQMSALESLSSNIKGKTGLTEGANPVDTATNIAGAATSIAGDVLGAMQSWIEAVGATKAIADTLVRGVANTEDVMGLIDNFQKYIQFAADVAGAVGSIASAAGSFTGGADFGATSAVGTVASLVSGALEAYNAAIDLGQEAYRIIGSYVGDFLGYLTGGVAGQLEGDVKFLLDEKTNQLLTYSTSNPQDKRTFDGIGGATNPEQRNQAIGQINVYGGPGSDPRDNTRQMMYQVRAAQFAGATSG